MINWLLRLLGPENVDPSAQVCHLSDYYEHQFRQQPARAIAQRRFDRRR